MFSLKEPGPYPRSLSSYMVRLLRLMTPSLLYITNKTVFLRIPHTSARPTILHGHLILSLKSHTGPLLPSVDSVFKGNLDYPPQIMKAPPYVIFHSPIVCLEWYVIVFSNSVGPLNRYSPYLTLISKCLRQLKVLFI